MTMVTFLSGGSLKIVCAILVITPLVQYLRPALGFISGVGVGDANNIRCLEGERQALLEFRKGLIDDYGRLSLWQSEDENKNCCNWEGVLCSNQTGHVLELHLSGSQDDGMKPFRGMISPSLFELPYLTFLDLSSNDFNQSHIPKFIGSLNNLKHQDLSWANLSGPIPHELENLSRLQYLNLGRSDLKIIENLKWLSHMSTIEYLDLSSTYLSVVANDWLEVVSYLPNLKTLSLWLCDLPPLSLSSLSHFNYSKSFAPLETLDLHHNQFVHIPKSFGYICTLRELYLSSNNFNGQLVELMDNLSGCAKDSLEVLDLSKNHITRLLPNFSIFPSLKNLNLSENELNGTLPKSIGNLSNLELLNLSSTSLSLKFSLDWVPPFQLDRIYLTSCNLGPTFPNWIQTQRKVSFLEISDANISDTIPAEWLEDLPSTLMDLNISSNQIHGQLPNRVLLPLFPTNLTFLNLSKNRYLGSISSLCKINAQLLAFLDLSDNMLSGRLPNCFMHWRKLIVLNLSGNNFFREVPTSLGSLSGLKTLNLNNNNFSGELPSSLGNCSSLIVMDLGKNRFSGKIPAWIGESLPRLFSLSLHSNKFAGSIPLHLCWSKDLQILDLSLNDISGTIPQCLNNFTGMTRRELFYREFKLPGRILGILKIIDLSRNKLTGKLPSESLSLLGEIPSSISNLTFLSVLNLSYNYLFGKIPSSTQLQSLDAFAFAGNLGLCGPPLTQLCPGEETPNQSEPTDDVIKDKEEDEDEFRTWFYIGIGFGSPIGFWGVCIALVFDWRHAYFLLLDRMIVNLARLRRKFQTRG
ncbi:hypothetical protein RGQ29_029987 [Quercus rubra]|uniref:Leucine-rich repeat-containing N-terminal plant-type domain-containing protein n=1 Tax=Quercus rubra TaxID=3512 RepID=A0AAN7EI26_QUERU|nr:hypothetical protein RGQ29_029987 [Quercus rubra]